MPSYYYYTNYSIQIFIKRKKNLRFAMKDEWDIREFIKRFENRLYFFFPFK